MTQGGHGRPSFAVLHDAAFDNDCGRLRWSRFAAARSRVYLGEFHSQDHRRRRALSHGGIIEEIGIGEAPRPRNISHAQIIAELERHGRGDMRTANMAKDILAVFEMASPRISMILVGRSSRWPKKKPRCRG
jgi:hypothetical protein